MVEDRVAEMAAQEAWMGVGWAEMEERAGEMKGVGRQEAAAGSQHAAREAKATVALPAALVAAEGVDAQAGTEGV